jgi:aminoglycoside phosphotransferase (APT) family kinase protein
MMRREAEVTQSLPDGAPAPALLHVLDDGFWVVLVFEDIEGALPTIPWDAQQLARVVEAMNHLSRLPTWSALPTVVERYGEMLSGWRILAAAGPAAVNEPWCRDHLEELAALEAQWEDAAAGDHLVHGDVRSDNVLFSNDGRVVFVDWSTSCIGAPWFDLVAMLPSIELEGGGAPESVLRLAESELDPQVLVPVVAAIAGYFVEGGRLPDPPGLPTLRDFQRAQARVTVDWLRRLWPTATH